MEKLKFLPDPFATHQKRRVKLKVLGCSRVCSFRDETHAYYLPLKLHVALNKKGEYRFYSDDGKSGSPAPSVKEALAKYRNTILNKKTEALLRNIDSELEKMEDK